MDNRLTTYVETKGGKRSWGSPGKMVCAFAVMGSMTAWPTPQAQAQTLLPERNTREIGFSANFLLNDDRPYNVSASYGYFFSRTLQVGVTGSVAGAKDTKTFTSLGAFGNYYFRNATATTESPLLPFAGIFLGYSHRDKSDGSIGGQAGVKYFLNSNVALTGEVQYRSTRGGSGNTALVFGISTFLR